LANTTNRYTYIFLFIFFFFKKIFIYLDFFLGPGVLKKLIKSLDDEPCGTIGIIVGPYRYTTRAYIKAQESKYDIILTVENNIVNKLKKLIYKILIKKFILFIFKTLFYLFLIYLFINFILYNIDFYLFYQYIIYIFCFLVIILFKLLFIFFI